MKLTGKFLLSSGLFCFLLLSSTFLGIEKEANSETITSYYETSTFLPSPSYVTRGAIEISQDSEFNVTNGVSSGTGTMLDPYIIENWNITVISGSGIFIHDTSAHFIIRNCWIDAGEGNSAPDYDGSIYIKNIADGTAKIENNVCSHSRVGIFLRLSNNNTLTDNTCINNVDGFFLWESNNNTVVRNECYSNTGAGISLYLSNSNSFVDNICNLNSNAGMYFYASHDN